MLVATGSAVLQAWQSRVDISVVRIIGPSGRVANTYLVDLGGGWGTVYHDDLRYIEDPRSLDTLQLDARWQPWQLVSDPTIAVEVTSNALAAVELAAPERRELFQQR
jgi:hypothetical protein